MDLQLPQDVLGCILAEIHDLYTLAQALRLSRRVYHAYQAHARGILEAVARNQFGSGFHLALRLVREQLSSEEHPDVPPAEPDLTYALTGSTSIVEIRRLSRNARAIHHLEIFFSQRYKDRSSSTSQLAACESRRLVRSLYVLWLIIDLFTSRWEDLPVPPLTTAEIAVREALHTEQRAFTFAILPDEAARNDLVNAFTFITKDVTSWASVCCCNSVIHEDILFIFPRLGLNFTMLAHVVKFAGQREYTPYTVYGHSPMYALREAFNRLFDPNTEVLVAPRPASEALGFLIQPSSMFEDACSGCSKVYQRTTHDPELYDARNWHMLNGDLPLTEIARASFPGNILENKHEQSIIAGYFEAPLLDRAQSMREMLAFGGQEPVPGRWLCRICIKNLLSEYAMAWWIESLKRRDRDVESLRVCSAGYACVRQKTDSHHAEQFNHFKPPDVHP